MSERRCACGCGRILVKSKGEGLARFSARQYATQSCASSSILRHPPVSERNREIIRLAEEGLPHGAIRRRLGLTTGAVAGALHRARNMGLLPSLDAVPDTVTPDPFPTARHCCMWPCGDPGTPGFRFCGAPIAEPGASYCDDHRALAYIRPRDKETA